MDWAVTMELVLEWQVCKTVPGSYFLNGPVNTHGDLVPFFARMFQFFTFVFMFYNYVLENVNNYLITKCCDVNLMPTFVFTFASSLISATFNCFGLMRKE